MPSDQGLKTQQSLPQLHWGKGLLAKITLGSLVPVNVWVCTRAVQVQVPVGVLPASLAVRARRMSTGSITLEGVSQAPAIVIV